MDDFCLPTIVRGHYGNDEDIEEGIDRLKTPRDSTAFSRTTNPDETFAQQTRGWSVKEEDPEMSFASQLFLLLTRLFFFTQAPLEEFENQRGSGPCSTEGGSGLDPSGGFCF